MTFSLQEGYGTPNITGYLEVEVDGKLVHSKKVCKKVSKLHLLASILFLLLHVVRLNLYKEVKPLPLFNNIY